MNILIYIDSTGKTFKIEEEFSIFSVSLTHTVMRKD